MFAHRVYDQDFLAAMADRGYYVFTSPRRSAAARLMEPGVLLTESSRAGDETLPVAPSLAEAA